MRLSRPRIEPATEADWTEDTRPTLTAVRDGNAGRVLNVFATMARHPKLFKRWIVFANHVLGGSTLPARERELIILRTGYVAKSGYEWAQHVAIARRVGVTDAEIERLIDGPTTGWADADRVLLQATDELLADHFITDATWTALRATWSQQQCMDIVFAVGQYCLVSMALNTFGVQLEDDTERFPPALFAGGRFPAR